MTGDMHRIMFACSGLCYSKVNLKIMLLQQVNGTQVEFIIWTANSLGIDIEFKGSGIKKWVLSLI